MHSPRSTIDHPNAGRKEVQACMSNRRPAEMMFWLLGFDVLNCSDLLSCSAWKEVKSPAKPNHSPLTTQEFSN